MLSNKNIILGVCGSIAAYKSAVLVRLLIKAGANVKVILTADASNFITPTRLPVSRNISMNRSRRRLRSPRRCRAISATRRRGHSASRRCIRASRSISSTASCSGWWPPRSDRESSTGTWIRQASRTASRRPSTSRKRSPRPC